MEFSHHSHITFMTLFLIVGKSDFESIIAGHKIHHTVKDCDYFKARLVNKNYNFIKFTNGIGKDRPSIFVKYNGYKKEDKKYYVSFKFIEEKKKTNLLELPTDALDIIGKYVKHYNRIESLNKIDIIKSMEFYWGKKTNHKQKLVGLQGATREDLIKSIDKLKIPLDEIHEMDCETYTRTFKGVSWSIVIDVKQDLIVIQNNTEDRVIHFNEDDYVSQNPDIIIKKILKRKITLIVRDDDNFFNPYQTTVDAKKFLTIFVNSSKS